MDNNIPNPTMTSNEVPAPAPAPAAPAPQQPAPRKSGGTGAFIGSLIIILILIVGAVYAWNTVVEHANPGAEIPAENMMTDSDDSADAIEADLEGSNYDNLDAEMADIDAEFEANQ